MVSQRFCAKSIQIRNKTKSRCRASDRRPVITSFNRNCLASLTHVYIMLCIYIYLLRYYLTKKSHKIFGICTSDSSQLSPLSVRNSSYVQATLARESEKPVSFSPLDDLDLDVLQDVVDDLATGRGAAEVARVHALIDRLVDGVLDDGGVMLVAQVTEHVDRRVQHRDRIGDVLASDAGAGVAGARLEHRVVVAVVLAGQQPGAAQQAAHHVRHDGAVQIRRQHDVELMRIRHQLHAAIVDDHVVVNDVRIVLGDPPRDVQEQTVRQLHDVRFVNSRHLLTAVPLRVLERVTGDALRVGFRDDLHALDDARDALVLQHGVLALGVLPHDHDIDVLLTGIDARIRHAVQHVHVEIQLVSQGDVAGGHVGLCAARLYVTLQRHAVPANRRNRVI